MSSAAPAGWSHVELGEVAEFRNGINYNKSNFGTGIPVISVKDFWARSFPQYDSLEEINPDGVVRPEHALKNGDILFVRSNGNRELIGRSLFIRNLPARPVTHSAFTIRVRFTSRRADPRFFAYLFRSPIIRQVLSAHGNGANISNLNQDILTRLIVALPPIEAQQSIAAILSAYDDLIENNTRRIAILEEMARRIYEEWFVRFRFPGHEGMRMVESELGLVPESWSVRAFDEIATFTNGFAFKPEHLGNRGVPIVKIKELKAGVQADTPRFIGSLPDRYRIRHGDLLFSWSADLDVYIWGDEHGWLNQHLFLVHALAPETPSSYLFHALKTAMPSFRARSNGATMKHIKRAALSEVQTAVPPSKLAAAFDQAVGPLHELVKVLSRKNRNLRTTRDLLLPKLISGELDVSAVPDPLPLAA